MRPLPQLRRNTLIAGAALALLLSTVGCDSGDSGGPQGTGATGDGTAALHDRLPERIRDAGKIVVSNPLKNPPYAFLEADGKTLRGIAPDLSRALEPLLGVEFEWVDTPFPGLIPGLQAGRFDMIWGSITDTEEREKVLDFVDYHMDGALLLVQSGNPRQISGLDSACGLGVGALSGSIQIEMLEDQSARCEAAGRSKVDVRVYPDVPGGLTAVRSGQAAAFFAGVGAARYQAAVAPDAFDTAGPIYRASPFGAGVRKDDRALTEAIQAGLKQLVADGTYAEVLDRYGMGLTALEADQILINGAARLNQEVLEIDSSP